MTDWTDAPIAINRGRTKSAKEMNPKWPEPNPQSRRQRIKAGEKRAVVRKKSPAKPNHEYVE